MLFIWVALYGLVNLIPEVISVPEERSIWLHAGLLVGYVLAFLFWICRKGARKEAGLLIPHGLGKAPGFLLLLAVFPLYNLFAGDVRYPGICFMVQMLCAALTEELFFRGFLLSALRKMGVIRAVVLTSLAFALAHGANFLESSDHVYVWLQVISSFFMSVSYCVVVMRFGSILPCVAAHFLTNITGTGSISGRSAYLGLFVSVAICAVWSLVLIMNMNNINKEKKT